MTGRRGGGAPSSSAHLTGRRPAAGPPSAGTGQQPTLREIGASIVEGRWLVLFCVALALAGATAYLLVARPIYRAHALLQFDEPREGVSHLEGAAAAFEPRMSSESELEILRSRLVVGAVVDQLKLDLVARPHWLPVVGAAVARRYQGADPAPPRMGLARFAWGGERIEVDRLEVPGALLGKTLILTARARGAYEVRDPHGALLAQGALGSEAVAIPGAPAINLLVSSLVARPGTEFLLEKRARDGVIDALQRDLFVEQRGKDTGVVVLDLEGDDPDRTAAELSALCATYLKHNRERSTAEARRRLALIEAQLPEVRARLDRAEEALNGYRKERRTVDLPLEAKETVERVAALDKTVADLEATRAQLLQRYSPRHPEVVAVERALGAAEAERSSLEPRVQGFPGTQLGSTRLLRDANFSAELYLTLLGRAQELRTLTSEMDANVRIVDAPFPARAPIRPKAPPIVALGLLLGLAGGVAVALGRRALDVKADDPRAIEAATGLPMVLTVPHSDREVQLQRAAGRSARVPLALVAPDDVATEQLRTLRTAMGFRLKTRPRVVVVSSPSADVGKSFLCANLAHLFAAAGQRVLLVDADLRHGGLHRYFSADAGVGLSDVLEGSAPLDAAIRATATPGLDLLPCGRPASLPAELLARPRLQELLSTAAARYDLVIVDTPPILAVTDALLVARCGTLNLLVLRSRQHSLPEISVALERFTQNGVEIQGGILNDARAAGAPYGRAYERRYERRRERHGAEPAAAML